MCISNNSTVTKQWTFMFGIPGIAFQMTLSSPAYKYKIIAFKKVVSFFIGEQMENKYNVEQTNPFSGLCLRLKHWIC